MAAGGEEDADGSRACDDWAHRARASPVGHGSDVAGLGLNGDDTARLV